MSIPPNCRIESRFHCHAARTGLGVLASAFLFAALGASAATQSWNPNGDGSGGNGTWDTGVTPDWDSGVVWTDSNDALFSGSGGTVTVVTPAANSLTFAATGPYLLTSGTLTLSGSNVTVDSDATIASTLLGSSGLTQSGGGTLMLTGSASFGTGTVDIEGGTFGIQNGGGLLDGTGYLGYNLNSNGTVTVSGSGSTWSNSATLYVGESGSGTLLVTSGGGVSSGSGAVIGDQAGSTGLATVSGSGGASTWIDGGDLVVSNSGSGTLKVSLGGGVSDVNGWIADGQGSSGLVGVSGTGTTWTNSGTLYVGESGNGTLRVLNGALVSNSNGFIGDQAGAVGMALVTGSGSTWMNGGDLYVGNSGSGTLVVSAGATAISGGTNGISIGNAAGSEGAVTVTGANSTLNNQASNPLQVKNLLVWCQASSLRKFCRPCRGLSRVGRVSGGSASLHPRLIAGWPSGPIIEGTCLTLH